MTADEPTTGNGAADTVRSNRAVWESASQKHVREYDDLLRQARAGRSLVAAELELLAPLLRAKPTVVHLQSGQGLDDVDLVRAGAGLVVGVDYSTVAATAAERRARELDVACRYVVAQLPPAPLADGCADLVYTGKGALIWMPDLTAWATDVARLLRRGGHLFVHEAHPMVPLYSWDLVGGMVAVVRGPAGVRLADGPGGRVDGVAGSDAGGARVVVYGGGVCEGRVEGVAGPSHSALASALM